jgi:hypothetical protein
MARVFISCGQSTSKEREVAAAIRGLLERRGFSAYVAIEVQNAFEINSGILQELKQSDCYLLVNFRRERIDPEYRGSLYANQEFAMAYALGFDKVLVINQEGLRAEGMLRDLAVNTETFKTGSECLEVVERVLEGSSWTPDYSRRLRAGNIRFSDLITYDDMVGYFLYLDIHNDRYDLAAMETTARLVAYGRSNINKLEQSEIRSPLKATGRPGYAHTIFPKSHEAFDVLCAGSTRDEPYARLAGGVVAFSPSLAECSMKIYLHSALDVRPRPSINITQGDWILQYEFVAIGFPLIQVDVELRLFTDQLPTARIVSQISI